MALLAAVTANTVPRKPGTPPARPDQYMPTRRRPGDAASAIDAVIDQLIANGGTPIGGDATT